MGEPSPYTKLMALIGHTQERTAIHAQEALDSAQRHSEKRDAERTSKTLARDARANAS
jgi:hypothetical protein